MENNLNPASLTDESGKTIKKNKIDWKDIGKFALVAGPPTFFGQLFPNQTLAILIFALVVYLFYLLGSWLGKKIISKPKLAKFIAWSNIVTWVVPQLGFLTGSASFRFSGSFLENRRKYKYLGILGFSLATIFAFIEYLDRMSKYF